MEAISLFSPFFFITVFLAFLVTSLIKRSWSRVHKQQAQVLLAPLPPGPPRLPLIGNIHQLVGGNPHRILQQLARTYGPLICLRLGQVDQVVASSVEAVEEIIKRHDLKFADRPTDLTFCKILTYGGCGAVMSPYGGYWKQIRKIYSMELLNSRRVKSFATIREDAVRKLMAEIAGKASAHKPINLSQMVMSLANQLTIRAAFGDKCKQQAEFLSLIKEAISYVSSFAVADMYPSLKFLDTLTGLKSKLERVHGKLDKIFDEIIAQRQVARAADQAEEDLIIDVLLKLKDEGNLEFPITSNTVKTVIMEIFLAGTETSSTIIGWAMSELIKNPKAMKKVQKEMREAMQGKTKLEESNILKFSYLNLVIKETMRLHSPVPLLLPRVCTETCEVMGYRVPVGTRVLINAFALGRDGQYWGSDVESFKPERFEGNSVDFRGFNIEFIPFGIGRRICPGMTFGLSLVEVALAHLLFHFDWKLPQGMKIEDLDMMEISGISGPRRSPLLVLAKPIIPLP